MLYHTSRTFCTILLPIQIEMAVLAFKNVFYFLKCNFFSFHRLFLPVYLPCPTLLYPSQCAFYSFSLENQSLTSFNSYYKYVQCLVHLCHSTDYFCKPTLMEFVSLSNIFSVLVCKVQRNGNLICFLFTKQLCHLAQGLA